LRIGVRAIPGLIGTGSVALQAVGFVIFVACVRLQSLSKWLTQLRISASSPTSCCRTTRRSTTTSTSLGSSGDLSLPATTALPRLLLFHVPTASLFASLCNASAALVLSPLFRACLSSTERELFRYTSRDCCVVLDCSGRAIARQIQREDMGGLQCR